MSVEARWNPLQTDRDSLQTDRKPISKPIGSHWNLLEAIGTYWNLSKPIETYWNLLEPIGTYWNLLEPIRVRWRPVESGQLPRQIERYLRSSCELANRWTGDSWHCLQLDASPAPVIRMAIVNEIHQHVFDLIVKRSDQIGFHFRQLV